MKAALALVCIVGCDDAFDLEKVTYVPPDAGPDAPRYPGQVINDPDSDFDGDGDPNSSDLCALIDKTLPGGRDDTDMDGVGDLCDPNPGTSGDCLVLFDSFEAATLSTHWKYDGQTVTREDPGYLRIPAGDQTLVYLDQPLEMSAVYVGGYVAYGANGPGARFAVQTLVDVTRTPGPTGTACSLESDKVSSRVAIVQAANGTDSVGPTSPVGALLVGAGSNAGLRWRADGCHGELQDGVVQSGTVAIPPPSSGVFGLRTLLASYHVYVVAAYGRGCGG